MYKIPFELISTMCGYEKKIQDEMSGVNNDKETNIVSSRTLVFNK